MRVSSGLYERQSQVAFDERLNDLKSLSVLKDPYSIRICFMMVLLPLPSVLYLAEMNMISISFSSTHHKVLKIDVVHNTYSLVVNTRME